MNEWSTPSTGVVEIGAVLEFGKGSLIKPLPGFGEQTPTK